MSPNCGVANLFTSNYCLLRFPSNWYILANRKFFILKNWGHDTFEKNECTCKRSHLKWGKEWKKPPSLCYIIYFFLNGPFTASFPFTFVLLRHSKNCTLQWASNPDRRSRMQSTLTILPPPQPVLFLSPYLSLNLIVNTIWVLLRERRRYWAKKWGVIMSSLWVIFIQQHQSPSNRKSIFLKWADPGLF